MNKKGWRRLDNSAKIFPMISTKRFSTVFRFSVVLKEKIQPEILKKAARCALEKFSFFKVRLRKGLFWYYFEANEAELPIKEEEDYPCQYIAPEANQGYVLRVTYFERKINLEIFHSLTDGNSAIEFFKEIVYGYLEQSHPEIKKEEIRGERKVSYNAEDSYLKYYDKKLKGNADGRKAYLLQGKTLPFSGVSVIHECIDLMSLKQKCRQKDCTITQYLTAVLMYAIYEGNAKKKEMKKPIKICIPVNLKKYFDSNTVSNFFSYITVVGQIEQVPEFDQILTLVKKEFSQKLTKEELSKTMSLNVKLGHNIMTRMIPLFLKKIILKISYLEIRKYTTTTFSNVGRIGILPEYRTYLDQFMMLIAPESVEKIKCSSCSYENQMVFTFTSILEDTEIQKRFYRFLQEQGIQVTIESNGVGNAISECV